MSLWLLIPAKALDQGKGRLAAVLSPSERRALNREFLTRILTVAAEYAGHGRTLVVSVCDEVLGLAEECGAHALREVAPSDLNSALEQARARVRDHGASELLVVASDLPFARAEDLMEMVDTGRAAARMVIATDRAGTGTNALYLPASWPIAFKFGAASCSLHQQQAALLGCDAVVLRRPRLAFDVDTQEDYADWSGCWLGGASIL